MDWYAWLPPATCRSNAIAPLQISRHLSRACLMLPTTNKHDRCAGILQNLQYGLNFAHIGVTQAIIYTSFHKSLASQHGPISGKIPTVLMTISLSFPTNTRNQMRLSYHRPTKPTRLHVNVPCKSGEHVRMHRNWAQWQTLDFPTALNRYRLLVRYQRRRSVLSRTMKAVLLLHL